MTWGWRLRLVRIERVQGEQRDDYLGCWRRSGLGMLWYKSAKPSQSLE